MKCRKCPERAAVHMRQHRLALCRTHFLDWMVEQTERIIQKYAMFSRHERVLLAVSGGKDSLSLWDILWRLGYAVDGIYIHLGIQTPEVDYSSRSEEYCRQFAAERGLALQVVNVAEQYGESIPATAQRTRRGADRPCAVCGLVKRHIMNRVARERGYAALATAHNLDDEAAVLYNNTFNWQVDLLRRQTPVLTAAPGFARKVKPFCRFYERETAAYAFLRGIPYIEEECPYAAGSTQLKNKELLNRLETEAPGTKLRFYVGFLKARQQGLFGESQPVDDEDTGLEHCDSCGQPTLKAGLCAFCKLYAMKNQAASK